MRQGIGTLSEKTVHAVMKNYYAPDTDMHEIPIEKFCGRHLHRAGDHRDPDKGI